MFIVKDTLSYGQTHDIIYKMLKFKNIIQIKTNKILLITYIKRIFTMFILIKLNHIIV